MDKVILLTCDVEALEFPTNSTCTDRCIYGSNLQNTAAHFGIEKMMDVAEQFGAKILFFYDVFTELSYPGASSKIFELINSRHHHFELHAHIEHIPDSWWNMHGFQRPTWASNYFDDFTARLVYGEAVSLFEKITSRRPIAFRAGSWRYCAQTLQALKDLGIDYSFNYYPPTAYRTPFHHGTDAGVLPSFQWNIGLTELPAAVICGPNSFSPQLKYFGFESHRLDKRELYINFMRHFVEQQPDHEIAILVMHSWSFLTNGDGDRFQMASQEHVDALSQFLEETKSDYALVTFEQVRNRISNPERKLLSVPIQFAGVGGSRLRKL